MQFTHKHRKPRASFTLLAILICIGSFALSSCSHASKPTRLSSPSGFIPSPSKQSHTKTTTVPQTTRTTLTPPPSQALPSNMTSGPLTTEPLLQHLPLTMDGVTVRISNAESNGKQVLLVLSQLPYTQAEAAFAKVCAAYKDPCTEYLAVYRGGPGDLQ